MFGGSLADAKDADLAALVRADGFLRLGIADRRGSVFEISAPSGPVELAVPAPLVR